ncbi:non-ribosomal peptide synthetase [Rhodopirellula sp. MGV]|uniref:non-ribosomal peptide synthetase n=1 Tax=Rhodopirellula sp. MGV TaxID=2023130 RepID=UPI000B9785C4|nr:non-ribosomal peptide synthetase [Rhodopirellula sp. MGV]OYP36658.1 hypothetical protein CGZ80_07690 [Rhodopirellula sp. MGV]PNY36087.1 hypothetical protein C2E31_14640 [Rhodopirellula baltica]PNY36121.1 hypothetical protein C2E31_14825 [Rhodopirellula baltica]
MDELLDGLSSQEKRDLLARLLKEKAERESSANTGRWFPQSVGQQGLWFAFQREPRQTASNVFFPSRFRSPLDLVALKSAVDQMVRRHDVLRTVFNDDDDGQPVQRVVDELQPSFDVIDMPGATDETLRARMLAECTKPFDLRTGPLLRLVCLRVANDDVVVIAITHHIVVDFWSLVIMMQEIGELYSAATIGAGAKLDPPANHYREFVEQQRRWLTSGDAERSLQEWEQQLAGVSPLLGLPLDFERPARSGHRANVCQLSFSHETTQHVIELARQTGVTENTVVLGLVQSLLARFSDQQRFAIGVPFSGRSNRRFEQTVGFFVNMLPIVADFCANPSFQQVVKTAGATLVHALDNERVPFAEIVKRVATMRDNSHHPLFQVSCTFEKSHVKSEQGRAGFLFGNDTHNISDHGQFAGLRQDVFTIDHPTCHYDLEFVFEFGDDRLRGMICYDAELFDSATIDSMSKALSRLAIACLSSPQTPVGQHHLTQAGSLGSESEPAAGTIGELLAHSESLMVRQAKQFASMLINQGVAVGDVVPVCLSRSSDAWIGILGVMLAGGTAVPIDRSQPSVEAEVLKSDASIRTVVSDLDCEWAAKFGVPIISVTGFEFDRADQSAMECLDLPSVFPEQPAYIIYTSGSTGKPKGVVVSHSAITNTLRWRRREIPLDSSDQILVVLSHQFDAAMATVLSALHQNAGLVWPTKPGPVDFDHLVELINEYDVTVFPAVPSFHAALADHLQYSGLRYSGLKSLRQLWCGGESLTHSIVSKIRKSFRGTVWNLYGPTEAAVEATAMRVNESIDPRRVIPIGFPIDGTEIFILNDCLCQQPCGGIGQIAIAGNGLAIGYLNRPELTAGAFVHFEDRSLGSVCSKRVYLTGDRGRKLADGSIEFLGRIDHQVKVAGYRIETEEIEQRIESLDTVRRAAVVVDRSSGDRLVAFVELNANATVDTVRLDLREILPAYKRPAIIHALDRLPVGTSGKVLREKLSLQSVGSERPVTKPRTDLEAFLLSRFMEELSGGNGATAMSIGIDDNFFESGGTSLGAATLASRLSSELQINVPSSLLFDESEVRLVAKRLCQLYPDRVRKQFGEASLTYVSAEPNEESSESLLVSLTGHSSSTPIVMVHPPGGIVRCYREIAKALPHDQGMFAVRARGLYGAETLPSTIQQLAADYAEQIQQANLGQRMVLGGWSLGGVFAFEVARHLTELGINVSALVLLDSTVPTKSDPDGPSAGMDYGIDLSLEQLGDLSPDEQLPFLYEHARRLGVLVESQPELVVQKVIEDLQRLFSHHVKLCQDCELTAIDIPVHLLRPKEVPGQADVRPDRGWSRWATFVESKVVEGHHHSMVQGAGAVQIAQYLDSLTR